MSSGLPSDGNIALVIDTDTASPEVVHSILKFMQDSKKLRDRVDQLLFFGESAMAVPLTLNDDAQGITTKVSHKRKPRLPDGASPEANIFFLRGVLEGLSGNTMRMHIMKALYDSPIAGALAFIGMSAPKSRYTVVVSRTPGLATEDVNWACAVAALEALGATPKDARRLSDAAWHEARVLAGRIDDADPAIARCCPSARAAPLANNDEDDDSGAGGARRDGHDLQSLFASIMGQAGPSLARAAAAAGASKGSGEQH